MPGWAHPRRDAPCRPLTGLQPFAAGCLGPARVRRPVTGQLQGVGGGGRGLGALYDKPGSAFDRFNIKRARVYIIARRLGWLPPLEPSDWGPVFCSRLGWAWTTPQAAHQAGCIKGRSESRSITVLWPKSRSPACSPVAAYACHGPGWPLPHPPKRQGPGCSLAPAPLLPPWPGLAWAPAWPGLLGPRAGSQGGPPPPTGEGGKTLRHWGFPGDPSTQY